MRLKHEKVEEEVQAVEYVSMAHLYHGVGRLRYSIDAI